MPENAWVFPLSRCLVVSWSRWRASQPFSVFLSLSQAFSANRAPLSPIQSRALSRFQSPARTPKTRGGAIRRSPSGIRYKPSSVLPLRRASIIYLRRQSLAASSNLPLDIGRATLNCRYTRSCNPRGVLPRCIATLAVGSYPAFSPLPLRAVILCYATIPSRTSSR